MLKFLPPILGGILLGLMVGAFLLYSNTDQSTEKQIQTAQNALNQEQTEAKNSLISALNSKVDLIGRFMAKTAPDLIVSRDFLALSNYQKEAAKEDNVVYAAYLKPNGEPLTNYNKLTDTAMIVEKRYAIHNNGELIGYVLIGVSQSSIERSIEQGIQESNRRIGQAISHVKETGEKSMLQFLAVASTVTVFLLIFISSIIYFFFRIYVVKPLKETSDLLENLAAGRGGDLTFVLPIHYHDEIGILRQAINLFISQLRMMVKSVAEETGNLSVSSADLRQLSQLHANHCQAQVQETSKLAVAITQMSSMAGDVTKNVTAAAQATQKAEENANQGRQIVTDGVRYIEKLVAEVEKTSEAILQLQREIDGIGSVLGVIRGISEQINLLALNAAIEAARAGEQGRGFAVVADEVRTLASRTQNSTQEIQTMIERLQTRANCAVTATEQGREQAQHSATKAANTTESLNEIIQVVALISDMNTQIAGAVKAHATVAEEINRHVINIKTGTDELGKGTRDTFTSSEKLDGLSSRLQQLVGQFKV